MTPLTALPSDRDDRRSLRRIMGWLPPWAEDHPVAWQTLYVLSFAASVATLLVVLALVRGDQPEWLQIALSTGAVTIVLALLYVVPHLTRR